MTTQAKPFNKILFTKTQQLLGENDTIPQFFPPEDAIHFDLNRKFFPESILFYIDVKLVIGDNSYQVASFLQPPLENSFELRFNDNDSEELLDYLTEKAFKKNTPLILENCFLHFSIERTSDRTQALEYYTDPFEISLQDLNPEKAQHEVEKSQMLLESFAKTSSIHQASQLHMGEPMKELAPKSSEEYQKPPNPTNMLQLFDMVVKMSDAIDSLQKSVKEIKQEMRILKQEVTFRREDDL